jgi:peptide/nickel transport system permease protein
MGGYITRRLIAMIPTWLIVMFVVVALVRLMPGSVIDILLEEQGGQGQLGGRQQVERQELLERLGLADPIPLQYVKYVGGVVQGDFGRSIWSQEPVTKLIAQRIPVTAEVAIIAFITSISIAIPLGVISAVNRDSLPDYILRSISIAGISVPGFAIATALILFPQLWWGWGISFQYVKLTEDPLAHLKILIPPAIVLGVNLSAGSARLTRTMMLEVLQQDYIRTARAKGLQEASVVLKHGLKNALIPVITVFGAQIEGLLGGSTITETVFALPGLGRLMVNAINFRDYPVVQGIVVLTAMFLMIMNLVVDVSYGWLDPRVRLR